MNNPIECSIEQLCDEVCESDIFVFAGGYEERSRIVPERLKKRRPKRLIIGITYRKGPKGNLLGASSVQKLLDPAGNKDRLGFEIEYSADRALEFEQHFDSVIEKCRNIVVSRVCIDISGMTQYVIMRVLAGVRDVYPLAQVTCIYVAATDYPPRKSEIDSFNKHREGGSKGEFPFSLTFEPAEPLFPKKFAGVGQRRGRSAMVLFAGYEKDRSHAAYDSINPAKLILIHSEPAVKESAVRLNYSRAVHEELGGRIEKSTETLGNLDVAGHLELLDEYYRWMYDQYDFVLVPVHSKLQSIACFLFWEQFPDTQVIFPVPVEYKEQYGGTGVGKGYMLKLPKHSRVRLFQER